jgi:hypothetical protein
VSGDEDGADMSTLHDPPECATLNVDEAAAILGISRTTATNPCDAARSRLDASVDASSSFATSSNGCSRGQNSPEHDDERFANFVSMKTGGDRYFEQRGADREFAEAYTAARREIERLDRLRLEQPTGRRSVSEDS